MLDAVIIGSGYGGMSAAALLARAGLKVIVLEKDSLIGGRASFFTDQEGYRWEYGAHSHRLAHKGIANQLLGRFGDAINFLPQAKDSKLIYLNRLWDRPEGIMGYLKAPFLSMSGRLTLLRLLLKIKNSDPAEWFDRTLSEFYNSFFHNKEVEDILPLLGFSVMCPDPSIASAGEVIDFVRRMLSAGISVGEPVGGSSQILRKLQFHVESSGKINLNEKALELIVEDSQVRGVRTERDTYDTGRVVFAARLPLLFEVADENLFPDEFVGYCKGIEHSSCLTYDFITSCPVTDIKGSIFGIDIPIWARFQTNADPTFTPQGRYLSTWGIMLPWGFDGNPHAVEETEKRLKTTIATLFPRFMASLVKERRLIIPVMNGNVLTSRQSKPHRPGIASDHVKGLYLVGDTVRGDGCSGDISFSSAMKAADAILSEIDK